MKISIIVPCYNEEKNIDEFYDRVVLSLCDKIDFIEVIFVNDGSKDRTLEKLKHIVTFDECEIKVISFSRNFGKEAAMYAGLEASTGDYVTIIDADLQQDPELVLDMLEVLKKNDEYDCVAMYQSQRKENKLISFMKDMFYKTINRVSDVELYQGASDFRLFKRSVVDAILMLNENERFSKGIFSWVGFNTYYMPYKVKERLHGESKWSFVKLLKYAISGITSFTTAPLKLSMFIGGIVSCSSIIYLIVSIFSGMSEKVILTKYDVLITLILFLTGMQFLCIGILGHYMAKIYNETRKRPVYIAKNVLSNENVEIKKTVKISEKKIS